MMFFPPTYQNGDGVVDENEKKLLHTLQEMDTNQDGEIGLVELCQMGYGGAAGLHRNGAHVWLLCHTQLS